MVFNNRLIAYLLETGDLNIRLIPYLLETGDYNNLIAYLLERGDYNSLIVYSLERRLEQIKYLPTGDRLQHGGMRLQQIECLPAGDKEFTTDWEMLIYWR